MYFPETFIAPIIKNVRPSSSSTPSAIKTSRAGNPINRHLLPLDFFIIPRLYCSCINYMMNLTENNDFEVLESTENNNPKTEEDETETDEGTYNYFVFVIV